MMGISVLKLVDEAESGSLAKDWTKRDSRVQRNGPVNKDSNWRTGAILRDSQYCKDSENRKFRSKCASKTRDLSVAPAMELMMVIPRHDVTGKN